MAGNKFTNSVLQRLELEQEQNTQPKPKQKAQSKTVTKKVTADNEGKAVRTSAPTFPDVSEYLNIETQRIAKNKTFYLDVDVIDALTAAARKQKVTDSKLCNDILRRILGIKR